MKSKALKPWSGRREIAARARNPRPGRSPVSTTHTITGAIVGVGAARRVSAVRWGLAGNIVIAWVVTLPATAVVSAMVYARASLA